VKQRKTILGELATVRVAYNNAVLAFKGAVLACRELDEYPRKDGLKRIKAALGDGRKSLDAARVKLCELAAICDSAKHLFSAVQPSCGEDPSESTDGKWDLTDVEFIGALGNIDKITPRQARIKHLLSCAQDMESGFTAVESKIIHLEERVKLSVNDDDTGVVNEASIAKEKLQKQLERKDVLRQRMRVVMQRIFSERRAALKDIVRLSKNIYNLNHSREFSSVDEKYEIRSVLQELLNAERTGQQT